MSKFFDSEMIQNELEEINNLQRFIYGSILTFGSMTREDKLEHIDKLNKLLDKQRVMYTRLSLSDDPQAVEMKENLKKSVAIMGFPPDTDMNLLFNSMTKTIESLKQFIDK
jgi:agmatine/peptidylarginine deiminase